MKFDKETVIVILIAAAVIVAWAVFYPKYQKEKMQEEAAERARIAAAAETGKTSPSLPAPSAAAVPEKAPAAAQEQTPASASSVVSAPHLPLPEKGSALLTLANDDLEIRLDPSTGGIDSASLLRFKNAHDSLPVTGLKNAVRPSLQCEFPGLTVIGAASAPEYHPEKREARISLLYSNGMIQEETVVLPETGYRFQVSYVLKNPTAVPVSLKDSVFWCAGVPPTRYFSGDKLYSERHNIDYVLLNRDGKDGKAVALDPAAKESKFQDFGEENPVSWTGSTNKYFASLLFVSKLSGNAGMKTVRERYADPENPKETYFVPAVGIRADLELPPGDSVLCEFSGYFGPKEMKEIRKLPDSVMDAMHFSYLSWFEFLARPMVRFLVYLHDHICHSYGLAIILLTILVRLIFWPVTQRANSSMRKMQKLQPKMKELREKYKDNPQEMNMRLMELYRTEKVSPLGGCLPILLQIPVFFALYSALDSAVELRQVGFLWCTDLAKPDLVGPQITLPFFGPTGLHPLVIAMTVLMVVQQKMTPSNMDPVQQKIMMLMPVIMLFMLYNLPSGLTLYWTVSQIFSILQMKYGQIIAKREEEKEAAHPKGKTA